MTTRIIEYIGIVIGRCLFRVISMTAHKTFSFRRLTTHIILLTSIRVCLHSVNKQHTAQSRVNLRKEKTFFGANFVAFW